MSKWSRGTLIAILACLLVASSALAGPGRPGSDNGDPDRPEITEPIGPREASVDSVDLAQGAAVTARSERNPDQWQFLYRLYLRLFRIFGR